MIVGLVGFIGAGKGTVADLLVERHDFVKESFANSVKDACATIFGWNRKLLEGDTPESRIWREQNDVYWSRKLKKEFTPRLALQLMGTEAGRDVFHPDLWVHTVMRRCETVSWHNYVIADVRFPNEINAIHEAGGIVVRVHRGEDPEWFNIALQCNKGTIPDDTMTLSYPEVHYSEWAWIGSDIDYTIGNDGDLIELEKKVDLLVNFAYNKQRSHIERG